MVRRRWRPNRFYSEWAAMARQAVAAEWDRVEASKRPKPQKPARKTFAHICDYREASR
jgi:hypothetical protein